jgi:hypothetical protein
MTKHSLNAEKEPSTRRTLHADVSTRKGANGELFLDNSIPHFTEKSITTAKVVAFDHDFTLKRIKIHTNKEGTPCVCREKNTAEDWRNSKILPSN